jgi:hypothetical protein
VTQDPWEILKISPKSVEFVGGALDANRPFNLGGTPRPHFSAPEFIRVCIERLIQHAMTGHPALQQRSAGKGQEKSCPRSPEKAADQQGASDKS